MSYEVDRFVADTCDVIKQNKLQLAITDFKIWLIKSNYFFVS